MSLLIVGSLALDTIEAPAGKREEVPGGSSSYCTIAASYFSQPHLVGVVGDDFPQRVIECFTDHHVDLQGLEIQPGKTFRWGGRYAANFDERTTLFTELNVFENFEPKLPAAYRASDFVLLANIHPGLQHRVLDQLTKEAFVILDTMNLWIEIARDELDSLMQRVNMLVINDEEARLLTGERHYGRAAKKLMAAGPEWIVIKKGQHGALLFKDDQVFTAPALILEKVIDPTGAGDSFVGGLIGYLAQSQTLSFDNMKLAVIYGSVMASFCVQDFSIDALTYLSEEDLETRFDEFIVISQF